MKFICPQTNLMLAVSIVQKAVSSKNTIPILSGIYLETTEENILILRTTDLEIGIEHRIKVQTIIPGKVVLPAKYFIEIVRHLPNAQLNFEKIEEMILITYEKSQIKINSFPADEFPNLPVIEENYNITLNSNGFKKTIRQVSIAASVDNTRPVFTGILFEFGNNQNLTVVATDTHRLALKQEKINLPVSEQEIPAHVILPGKVLQEVSRLIDPDSMINLIIGKNNQVVFSFANTLIYSRLIQGAFPNYKQVIPVSFKTVVKINVKNFSDILERAVLLTREDDSKSRANNVKLTLQEDTLLIDSYAAQLGNIHEEMFVEATGEEITISFNARYLLDALKVLEDKFVSVKFTGSLSPAVIETSAAENYLYLILPVRSC